jgi:hypothetical protein
MENVKILNRLQLLALRYFSSEFKNLKIIAFEGFGDGEALKLYKKVFDKLNVLSIFKSSLLNSYSEYAIDKNYALVIHNNR